MVYGYSVDALCIIRYLIEELELPGTRIAWVQPNPPPPPPPFLKSDVVREALVKTVKSSGKHNFLYGVAPNNSHNIM